MSAQPPPPVAAAPGAFEHLSQQNDRRSYATARPVRIAVALDWVPGPSGLPWVPPIVVLFVVGLVVALTPKWWRVLAVLLGVLVLSDMAHAIGFEIPRPGANLSKIGAVLRRQLRLDRGVDRGRTDDHRVVATPRGGALRRGLRRAARRAHRGRHRPLRALEVAAARRGARLAHARRGRGRARSRRRSRRRRARAHDAEPGRDRESRRRGAMAFAARLRALRRRARAHRGRARRRRRARGRAPRARGAGRAGRADAFAGGALAFVVTDYEEPIVWSLVRRSARPQYCGPPADERNRPRPRSVRRSRSCCSSSRARSRLDEAVARDRWSRPPATRPSSPRLAPYLPEDARSARGSEDPASAS